MHTPTFLALAALAASGTNESTPRSNPAGAWGDLDLDGRLDLVVIEVEGRPRLLRQDPGGGFQDVSDPNGLGDVVGVAQASWSAPPRPGARRRRSTLVARVRTSTGPASNGRNPG